MSSQFIIHIIKIQTYLQLVRETNSSINNSIIIFSQFSDKNGVTVFFGKERKVASCMSEFCDDRILRRLSCHRISVIDQSSMERASLSSNWIKKFETQRSANREQLVHYANVNNTQQKKFTVFDRVSEVIATNYTIRSYCAI